MRSAGRFFFFPCLFPGTCSRSPLAQLDVRRERLQNRGQTGQIDARARPPAVYLNASFREGEEATAVVCDICRILLLLTGLELIFVFFFAFQEHMVLCRFADQTAVQLPPERRLIGSVST